MKTIFPACSHGNRRGRPAAGGLVNKDLSVIREGSKQLCVCVQERMSTFVHLITKLQLPCELIHDLFVQLYALV